MALLTLLMLAANAVRAAAGLLLLPLFVWKGLGRPHRRTFRARVLIACQARIEGRLPLRAARHDLAPSRRSHQYMLEFFRRHFFKCFDLRTGTATAAAAAFVDDPLLLPRAASRSAAVFSSSAVVSCSFRRISSRLSPRWSAWSPFCG